MSRLVLTQILFMVAFAAGGDVVLGAQTTLPKLFTNGSCQSDFQENWNTFHAKMQRGDRSAADQARTALIQDLDPFVQPGCVSDLLISANPQSTKNAITSALVALMISTAEKQAGSSVSSSGSTSLVSKNFASEFFSLANEYGALSSSTSGQTTTLSGSLDGLFTPFAGALSG